MMSSTATGIYFHPQRREILAVTSANAHPGEPWVKFTDDYGLGLLGARRELERLGFTHEANRVEWHGMAAADIAQRQRVSGLIRSFREDSDQLRSEAEAKPQDLWRRLVSALASPRTSRGEEV